MGVGKDAFSPQSQSAFKLWVDLHLSDEDVDDKFTDNEGKDRRQTPLLAPGKHSHLSSDDEKSPSKKAKLDVSNLYGATPGTSGKGVGATWKDNGAARKGDGTAGEGDEDSESKAQTQEVQEKQKETKQEKQKGFRQGGQ